MEGENNISTCVIGVVGTIQKELGAQLEKSGIKLSMDLVQKTALLETAEILRKVVWT